MLRIKNESGYRIASGFRFDSSVLVTPNTISSTQLSPTVAADLLFQQSVYNPTTLI